MFSEKEDLESLHYQSELKPTNPICSVLLRSGLSSSLNS